LLQNSVALPAYLSIHDLAHYHMAAMTPAYPLPAVCTKRPFGEEYQKRPALCNRVEQVIGGFLRLSHRPWLRWTAQKNWLCMGIWVMLVKASRIPHISCHLEPTELRLTITPQETEAGMAQLVFVDLETTGLDVERHGIIEIACIFETDGTREAAGLHSLVSPGDVEHTEEAAAVHNIPREAIDAAPPLLDVLRQFDSRCADGAIVSGWNTKFDEAFLYMAYRQ